MPRSCRTPPAEHPPKHFTRHFRPLRADARALVAAKWRGMSKSTHIAEGRAISRWRRREQELEALFRLLDALWMEDVLYRNRSF